MKPYFAKYLLVEGEIEVGDKVESESSGRPKVTVISITEKGDYVTDERDWYEPDSYFVLPKEKAKKFSKTLFLCRRDVKMGDKVKFKDISVEVDIPIDENNWNWLSKHAPWSTVGEISPEAIWVKEGDEFDNSDICNPIRVWDTKVGFRDFVGIKCPTCKKFH